MPQSPNDLPNNPTPAVPINYGTGYAPATGKTSGAAITSLILGILGCVPYITGIGAVIFGIVGLRAARKPGVTGKGLAGAGLALGILSLLGWTGLVGMLGWAYAETAPDRRVATAFVQDLAASNVPVAQARCVPAITASELTSTAAQMNGWGPFKSVTFTSFNYNANASTAGSTGTGTISGIAAFGNTSKTVTVILVHPSGGGPPLIQSCQFQ